MPGYNPLKVLNKDHRQWWPKYMSVLSSRLWSSNKLMQNLVFVWQWVKWKSLKALKPINVFHRQSPYFMSDLYLERCQKQLDIKWSFNKRSVQTINWLMICVTEEIWRNWAHNLIISMRFVFSSQVSHRLLGIRWRSSIRKPFSLSCLRLALEHNENGKYRKVRDRVRGLYMTMVGFHLKNSWRRTQNRIRIKYGILIKIRIESNVYIKNLYTSDQLRIHSNPSE